MKIVTADILGRVAKGEPVATVTLGFFAMLLADLGKRAAEINDPRLNEIMARLGIYAISEDAANQLLTWAERYPTDARAEMGELKKVGPVKRYLHLSAQLAGRSCSAKKAAALKRSSALAREKKRARQLPPTPPP